MFRFSTLLSKHDAEVAAGRQRRADAAAPGFSVIHSKDAEPLPNVTGSGVSDRLRRDLDEQMQRLANLLERVESAEFEQQATAADIFSISSEESPCQPPAITQTDRIAHSMDSIRQTQPPQPMARPFTPNHASAGGGPVPATRAGAAISLETRQFPTRRRLLRPARRPDEAASIGGGSASNTAGADSGALNILAVCGALLTVAALLYLAVDLLGWL